MKFCSETWAITQTGALAWLSSFRYLAPAAGSNSGKRFDGNDQPQMRIENGCAVIPIKGVLIRGASALEQGYGAVSHYSIAEMVDEAESNPAVKAILFDIESPGGTVSGTPELGDTISNISKPCAAFTDSLIGSAAYWLASQCGAIYATSGALVGGVGAIMTFTSMADMLTSMGVDVNLIQSGSLKSAGSPLKKMSDAERDHFQNLVNAQGAAFRKTVRRKRPAIADADMQGQVHLTTDAVAKGLVDSRVSGMRQAMAALSDANWPNQREAVTKSRVFSPQDSEAFAGSERAWRSNAALRAEFGSLAAYRAWLNHGRGSWASSVASLRAGEQAPSKSVQELANGKVYVAPYLPSRRPPKNGEEKPAVVAEQTPAPTKSNAESDLASEFSASPALQSEFGSLKAYAAFARANRGGNIKIVSRRNRKEI
ncbi:MAG TPA: S49 family peptidase [Verrucomicrobiae bacterium]|nr:S49 family peptidase [Verrucomicrobiae bacterium]